MCTNELVMRLSSSSNNACYISITLQKVFDEAESCLKDLEEATPGAEDYLDECSCANNAVNHAFTAYVDLLEDLRRANPQQLDSYSQVRNAHACNLKRLRQKLDEILVLSPPETKVA